ncbi:hypothetical protein JCM5296_004713 [Sporobolomyces johnsonii]
MSTLAPYSSRALRRSSLDLPPFLGTLARILTGIAGHKLSRASLEDDPPRRSIPSPKPPRACPIPTTPSRKAVSSKPTSLPSPPSPCPSLQTPERRNPASAGPSRSPPKVLELRLCLTPLPPLPPPLPTRPVPSNPKPPRRRKHREPTSRRVYKLAMRIVEAHSMGAIPEEREAEESEQEDGAGGAVKVPGKRTADESPRSYPRLEKRLKVVHTSEEDEEE